MNLLFDFLKNLPAAEVNTVKTTRPGGKSGEVFDELLRQAETGTPDRAKIQREWNLSDAHFDKISSSLLAASYTALFPDGGLSLLGFLSSRSAFVKHYYKELNRQLPQIDKLKDKETRTAFYKGCIDHIHFNLAIINKNSAMLKKLGEKYVQSVKAAERQEAAFWFNCRWLFHQVDIHFAAADSIPKADRLRQEIQQKLGNPKQVKKPQLVFEYYWLYIYYYLAIEDFDTAIETAKEAKKRLQQFASETTQMNILRIDMKIAEMLYFSSHFEESFIMYRSVIRGPRREQIPERGYFITKYIQICLITGHLKEAREMIDLIADFYEKRLHETLPVREMFSFIKYHLFAGNYDTAFEFLQLGFLRNPKGRYFQYEVELRNLQIALFFMLGKEEETLQMCERNLKFLRTHGYGVRQSDFPYFYILTRAIIQKRNTRRPFTKVEKEKLARYNSGSYALYGRLLTRMLEKK